MQSPKKGTVKKTVKQEPQSDRKLKDQARRAIKDFKKGVTDSFEPIAKGIKSAVPKGGMIKKVLGYKKGGTVKKLPKAQTGGAKSPKKPSSMDTAWNMAKSAGEALINPGGAALKAIKKAYANSDLKKINDSLYRAEQRRKDPRNQNGPVTRKKGGAIKTNKKK